MTVTELLGRYWPSLVPRCCVCGKVATDPEKLYQLGDDRWYCMSDIVAEYDNADRIVTAEARAKAGDAYEAVAALRHTLYHFGPTPGCDYCAAAGRFRA